MSSNLSSLTEALTMSATDMVYGVVGGNSRKFKLSAIAVALGITLGASAAVILGASATLNLAASSSLITSGGNSITLTSTGATNVTLPTTGTLVNSAVATLSSLTSIGTIGIGVWQGTAIAAGFGGTGLTSYAIGDLIYASAVTPTLAKLAAVAVGSVLVSAGVNTAPAWSATPQLTRLGIGQAADGTIALAVTGTAAVSASVAIAGNGTAAIPAYALRSANTGLWSSASNAIDFTIGGATSFELASGGRIYGGGATAGIYLGSGDPTSVNPDTFLIRLGAANFRQGNVPSGSPIAQLLTVGEFSRGGTDSNVSGGGGTLQLGGLGTGTGTVAAGLIQVGVLAASGTTQQAYGTAITIKNTTLTGIQFNGYASAGLLSTDGSGNITTASSEKLKNIRGKFLGGIERLAQISPILWNWKTETNLNTDDENIGFSAEEAESIFPELHGLGDPTRAMVAACVNAIKELNERTSHLA